MAPRRKRQKSEHDANKNAGQTVVLNDLAWREVPFPENFDDAEGFFGLEEISDVEVDRDASSGRVGYKLTGRNPEKKSNGVTPKKTRPSVENQEGDIDQEWGGFEDEGLTSGPGPKKAKTSNRVPSKDAHENGKHQSHPSNFEVLGDLVDDVVNASEWDDLGLSHELLMSLSRMKLAKPTPIQKSAIPAVLEGHDVIGKAPTGSGKTLAFGIPIIEHFLSQGGSLAKNAKSSDILALIISPTRELAHQLSAHLTALCSYLDGPIIATVTGGLSLHKQRRLTDSANIIVGTPGRLWELISGIDGLQDRLHNLRFLVLDEADRLLSQGHYKELSNILDAVDHTNKADDASTKTISESSRQILVFSATFRQDLHRKLTERRGPNGDSQVESMGYLMDRLQFKDKKPKFIDVNPNHQMAEHLNERIVECGALEKDEFLYMLLLLHYQTRVLVFANSIGAVRRLTLLLQNLSIQVQALHSQMPQKARLRSVERFSSMKSTTSVLIATDVAARGLDIPSVDLIIHYHVPRAADMYVHRSGRTARAEKSGSSILLCAPDEVKGVRQLIVKVHDQPKNSSKSAFISTMHIDRQIISRLKPRLSLSQKITNASLAKEKHNHEDKWLRNAAEDAGLEYDSEEFEATQGRQKGRGYGRLRRENAARDLSKEQLATLRAQLKQELNKRVNVGVSEKYLTAGGIDVDALLQERERGQFLGSIDAKTLVT